MIVSFKMPQDIYLDANEQYNIEWHIGLENATQTMYTVYYKYHSSL